VVFVVTNASFIVANASIREVNGRIERCALALLVAKQKTKRE
jgi:hypothetical protein